MEQLGPDILVNDTLHGKLKAQNATVVFELDDWETEISGSRL